MAAWFSMDGRKYREREAASFATEDEARAEAVKRGATLTKERMQGAFYRTPEGTSYRISARGWASGFVLWETVEDRTPEPPPDMWHPDLERGFSRCDYDEKSRSANGGECRRRCTREHGHEGPHVVGGWALE